MGENSLVIGQEPTNDCDTYMHLPLHVCILFCFPVLSFFPYILTYRLPTPCVGARLTSGVPSQPHPRAAALVTTSLAFLVWFQGSTLRVVWQPHPFKFPCGNVTSPAV